MNELTRVVNLEVSWKFLICRASIHRIVCVVDRVGTLVEDSTAADIAVGHLRSVA